MSTKALLFIAFVLIGCKTNTEPVRKPGIPADAKWYGGADGGCWIKTGHVCKDTLYDVVVFNDMTGMAEDSGAYKLCNECLINADSLVDLIDAYDGHIILLNKEMNSHQCYLHKIRDVH